MQRVDVYDRRYDESTQQTTANTCPECDGRVTMNVAETVCDDCGLVLAEQGVDTGPEWRNFEDGENQARTGAPRTPSRHDRGLSTTIGRQVDANGNPLAASKRRRLARMRREHSRAGCPSTAERNERHGLTEIARMTSALGFSEAFRDRACRLFSTAQDADLLRGRTIETMAAASVYAACRCDGRPQTLADVAAVAQVDESKVQMGYDVLNQELGLAATPRAPDVFLSRLRSALGFSQAVEQRAAEVLAADRTFETTGANPAGVAAGAILLAATELNEAQGATQADVAAVADVSVTTVRRYRDHLHTSH